MKIIYGNSKTEKLCTNLNEANKKLNKKIALKLMSAINYIENAKDFKDISSYAPFNFHNLSGKFKNKFAIDVDGRKSGYRIILEPLDKENKRFIPCNIDEIIDSVKIILILEVSNHYE